MNKIKKNDTVKVIAGRDKGKNGKVLAVYGDTNRALVEGVNYIKKHMRKSQQDPQGGIVSKESSIHISNLMLLCKACNRPTRVGILTLSDGTTKTRACKRCSEVIS